MKFVFPSGLKSKVEVELHRLPRFESVSYFIQKLAVDLVLDVGMNKGEFAQEVRNEGYSGRLIGFEPLSFLVDDLNTTFSDDPDVSIWNMALGDANETKEILFDRERGDLASFCQTTDYFKRHYGDINSNKEVVEVRRLDGLREKLEGDRVFLKVDTQGYDLEVLKGAEEFLKESVVAILVEMPIHNIYDTGVEMKDIVLFLRERGYFLRTVSPAATGELKELIELNGVFIKSCESEVIE